MTAVTLDPSFEKDVTDLLIKYRGIQSSIESTKVSITEIEDKIKELECEKNTLKLCKPIIDDIISKFSDSLLRKLEELLTIGLKKIFYDREYSIQIRVVDKRNSKCVELLLNDSGNLIPVRNANVAGGVLVVIASIIQIFYIINLPNVDNYMFLDDKQADAALQIMNYREQNKDSDEEYYDLALDYILYSSENTGYNPINYYFFSTDDKRVLINELDSKMDIEAIRDVCEGCKIVNGCEEKTFIDGKSYMFESIGNHFENYQSSHTEKSSGK